MSTSKKSKRRGKKKRRINTRLLTIVSLVTIMAVGVVGGLIYLKYKGSVARNLSASRAYLEEGEYASAMRAAGKVLYQESGNQEAHGLRIAAFEGIVPETPERASTLYRKYVTALAQRAQFSLGDNASAIAALDECFLRPCHLTLTATGQCSKCLPRVSECGFPQDPQLTTARPSCLALPACDLAKATFSAM